MYLLNYHLLCSARGEVLTTEKAIEFMIHERQLMDQVRS